MQLLHAGGLPSVLDTAGVAELLGLNPRTVLLMVRDGRLPGRRVPGGRKYQFLTDEVLAALAPGDGQTHDPRISASPAPVIGAPLRTGDIDPCDVWGAAPTPRGPDWALTCLEHWMARAADAGLTVVCITAPHADTRGSCVGIVAVDDLMYRVLVAPRKRARVVDDDGDIRWALMDAVWVEPVADVEAAADPRQRSLRPSAPSG